MLTKHQNSKKKVHFFNSKLAGKLSFNKLIWTMTKICPWDCQFCCIDAYHISQKKHKLYIKKNGLRDTSVYTRNYANNRYEDAFLKLKEEGQELSFLEKMMVLKNIDTPVEIDFSGGDPLVLNENLDIIKRASQKFGKENISVTTTGVGLSLVSSTNLVKYVNGVEFTYDYSGNKDVPFRMDKYNYSNLAKVKRLKQFDVNVTAQIPITKANLSYKMIKKIYMDLTKASVDEILLMKLLPVGRGESLALNDLPSIVEQEQTVEVYKQFESIYKGPIIKNQSVLKNALQNIKGVYSNSLNITSKGMLLSSPWAYNGVGEPIEDYIIGDMKINRLSGLISNFTKKEN